MSIRNTLLLADDMSSNRAFLCKLFEDDYDLLEAEDGEETLQLLAEYHDRIAAVLLDIIMPVKDGYQVLVEMRERGYLPDIPVIVVTSDSSQKSEARALELGALDLVAKPYDPYVIRRRVQNLVELKRSHRMLAQQVGEMAEVIRVTDDSIVNTLATITEFRSLESGQHILRIRKFVQILLEEVARSFPEYELGDKKIATISSAAVLHDIGKISVPDSVLNKPSKLTDEEFAIMKTHTTAGCEILDGMTQVVDREYMRYAYNICRYHHERWDGRGYPDGLKGENIPICAQVVGIADVYDALTTKRVYKDAMAHEESVNMILNGECGAFNPRLLECFKHVREDFSACAKAYADGEKAIAEDIRVPLPPPKAVTAGLSTQQMATIKYHTLLGYVGGVVVEVDVASDTYHLVYNSSKMFTGLRNDGSFENVILQLIKNSVHPEDRTYAWQGFAYLKKGFFEEGLRRYARKFRMRADEESGYFWAECTFLRLDTGDPNQRKAIVAWRGVADHSGQTGMDPQPEKWGDALLEMVGFVVRSRNDKWQSILDGGDRLAEMLGYTQEEFRQSYQDRLLSIILPEDRETVVAHVNKQLSHADRVEAAYRLLGKKGRIVWVRDRARVFAGEDGMEYVHHVIMDNTNLQEALNQLRSTRERHQILLNQIDEIAFEWDASKDAIAASANFKRQLGYELEPTGLGQKLLDGTARVHPEDLGLIQELVRAIRGKRDYPNRISADFRIQKADGDYVWYRMRANVQQMDNGKTECIIGTLSDIDADKLILSEDQEKTDHDALTKLYTKQVARKKIERCLSERRSGERSALILIDLDHFREVNLRYGRIAGDSVLRRCAKLMHQMFRRGDILARIGGDEFMVLMKSVPSEALLQRRCEHLIGAISNEIAKEMPDSPVTCTVGMAVTPGDGSTFDELFQRAAQALLRGKARGSGSCAFYQPGEQAPIGEIMANTPIESDDFPGLADQGLVFYAFNRLYRSGNVEETIGSILEMVGRQMNASRVYIFENSPDNSSCSNTFEWCNEGIEPQKDNLQNVSYETDIPGWTSYYNAQGVFLSENIAELPDEYRAILEPQGIRSMLQCAIMDGDVFRGFVGLDECQVERTWTRDQVDVLSMIAKLTAVFLLKKRVQDISDQWAQDLVGVLEYSPSWCYVIDPDTCEILFSNSRARDRFPQVKPGAYCYEAMMGRDERCENCAALDIRETKRRCGQVFHERLGAPVQTEATLISWNGRDAALVMSNEPLAPEKT